MAVSMLMWLQGVMGMLLLLMDYCDSHGSVGMPSPKPFGEDLRAMERRVGAAQSESQGHVGWRLALAEHAGRGVQRAVRWPRCHDSPAAAASAREAGYLQDGQMITTVIIPKALSPRGFNFNAHAYAALSRLCR